MDEWDIFKIGDGLFTNDPKNKESIDQHLVNSDDEEDNDSPSSSSSENSGESEDEREEITSLEEAVDVHDVTMLLLRKFISDSGNKELIRVLNGMESHQGHTEIDKGYKLDNYLEEFLGDTKE